MLISKETVGVGILAIACGLVGAYGVRSSLLREKPAPAEPQKAKAALLKLPMASLDLPVGRVIAAGDISMFPMSPQTFQKRQYRPELIMMSPDDIIGRRLREPVKQGDPFLTTALYPAGTGPNVTERLKAGYRAVTLYISNGGLNGVTTGSYVDLLFRTLPRAGGSAVASIPEMIVTLLSQVEVLSVEGEQGAGAASPAPTSGSVTLAIPVDQVSRLRAVEGRGEFSLIPRAADDKVALSSASGDRLTLEDALGIEPPPPPFRTVIYRRGSPHVNTFVDGQLVQLSQATAPQSSASGQPTPASQPNPQSAQANAKECKDCKKKGQSPTTLTPIPAQRSHRATPLPARVGPTARGKAIGGERRSS